MTPETRRLGSARKVYVVEASRRYRGAEANTSATSFELVAAARTRRLNYPLFFT